MEVPIQGKMTPIANVIYVPNIRFNLLSIGQLTARGIICEFVGKMAILSRRGETVATSTRKGMGIYPDGTSARESRMCGTQPDHLGAIALAARSSRRTEDAAH